MPKGLLHHPILDSMFGSRLLLRALRQRAMERRVPGLSPSRRFHAELELEMLRADRMGSPLTLLLFAPQDASPGAARESHGNSRPRNLGLEKLAGVICEIARKTDTKGWFRDAGGLKVALILFHTVPEKTERIVEKIRQKFREAMADSRDPAASRVDLACEIYAYPAQDGEGGGGGGGHGAGRTPSVEIIAGGDKGNGNGGNGGGIPADEFPSARRFMGSPLPLWKRGLDFFASALGLLALAPLFALIAVAVKLSSPGPVFFKQPRVGYLGRIFLCWKFRSMRADANPAAHKLYLAQLIGQTSEGQAPMRKLDAQDRQITAAGRLLRASCLDELPQLINVLWGEMSLVGPRPCLPYEVEKYQRWHCRRLDVVPGITGLWQVMGKNKTTFRQMIQFDIVYTRQRSIWLDIKILCLTIPAILHEIRDWAS